MLITAPLSNEWDYLLLSSDDEGERGRGARSKKKKDGKAGWKIEESVTDLFAQKKSKEQIAREEQEAREMLARHREKMGNYYLGGEVPSARRKARRRRRRRKKDQAVEALPESAEPEPEIPAYMQASMAGDQDGATRHQGRERLVREDEYASKSKPGAGKIQVQDRRRRARRSGRLRSR